MFLRMYASLVAVVALCLTAGAGNLIVNPSFEEQKNNDPVGWVRFRLTPEELLYSELEAHDGRYGVGIKDKKDKEAAGWMSEDFIRVEPGKAYRLGGWICAENAWGDNSLSVALFTLANGKPKWVTTLYTSSVDGRKPWTRVELEFTVPENITFAKICAGRRYASPGIAYFDDLSLEAGSTSAATAPETAKTLIVDWAKAVAADNPGTGKLLRQETMTAGKWTKLEANGGTLSIEGDKLVIADTALPGVGWLSPAIAVTPDQVCELSATVSTRKAWHARLAVIMLDKAGQILEIRWSDELDANLDQVSRTLRCRPADGVRTIRFAVIQSRSGGRSEFGKLMFREYEGEINE